MDPNTQKLIQQLRSITLSDKERSALRAALVARMRENVPQAIPSPWMWFLHAKRAQVGFLSLLIVAGYGSTVTLAAESALPGSMLYPIKTLVTEPATRLITAKTPSAQADFETMLLNERLKEAETLYKEMKLTEPLQGAVREGIREQNAKAEMRVRDAALTPAADDRRLVELRDTSTAQDTEEDQHEKERALEGVLEKHKDILEKLDLVGGRGNGRRGEE